MLKMIKKQITSKKFRMSSMDKKQENFRKMKSLSNFYVMMKFHFFVHLTNSNVLFSLITKALQNWKIFVNSFRNDYAILTIITKRLWRLQYPSFRVNDYNETIIAIKGLTIITIIISKNGEF